MLPVFYDPFFAGKTDMTSQNGMRDPADGAKNAVIPATVADAPTGEFYADFQVSQWWAKQNRAEQNSEDEARQVERGKLQMFVHF